MKDHKNYDTFQKGKTFLQIILLEKDPRFMILHTSQNGVASFWVAIDCHLMINIIIYQLRNLFINIVTAWLWSAVTMVKVSSLLVKLIATSTASSRARVSSIAIFALGTKICLLRQGPFTCLHGAHGLSCPPQPSEGSHWELFPVSPRQLWSSPLDLVAPSSVRPRSPCGTSRRDQEPWSRMKIMMIDGDYDQNLEVHVQRDLDIEKNLSSAIPGCKIVGCLHVMLVLFLFPPNVKHWRSSFISWSSFCGHQNFIWS